MILRLIIAFIGIGFILYLVYDSAKRNDVYNQSKLEDEESSNDESIDTHF
jgi:hypothetical protein